MSQKSVFNKSASRLNVRNWWIYCRNQWESSLLTDAAVGRRLHGSSDQHRLTRSGSVNTEDFCGWKRRSSERREIRRARRSTMTGCSLWRLLSPTSLLPGSKPKCEQMLNTSAGQRRSIYEQHQQMGRLSPGPPGFTTRTSQKDTETPHFLCLTLWCPQAHRCISAALLIIKERNDCSINGSGPAAVLDGRTGFYPQFFFLLCLWAEMLKNSPTFTETGSAVKMDPGQRMMTSQRENLQKYIKKRLKHNKK